MSRWSRILFDLDGVLVDSRRPISRCLNLGLEGLGLAPEPEARLHGFIGVHLDTVFRELLAERGEDPERTPECIAHYREHYAELSLSETRAFDGIPEALAQLAARRLAVATAKPAHYAVPILETLGLAARFESIQGPPLDRTHEVSKAQIVAAALAALDAAAPDPSAVMVGDRYLDIEAGRANGIETIGVCWGIGSEQELRDAGATHLVESPLALAALVEGRG